MKLKHLFFFLSIFIFSDAYSQLSKKHYIPPLTSGDNFREQYIFISTPQNNNVTYKIIPIGNPELSDYSGVVSRGNPVLQPVLRDNGFSDFDSDTQLHINRTNINGNKIDKKGFIIEASDPIYVSIRVRTSAINGTNPVHAGALVSKGSAALGTQFRIGAMINEPDVPNPHTSFASMMATEDNTNINLSGFSSGASLPNGSPIISNITLDEGESFIVAMGGGSGDPRDLVGSLIESDKPIVVNSGSATGSFGPNGAGGGGQDYGFDQIVGADKIGDEYILVKGNGEDSIENALIIAHEDNTEIFFNGSSITTINAGEYFVAEGNQYSTNNNLYIRTSKPTFVYQGIGTSSLANQGLFFVPPLSCENKGDVNEIANIDKVDNSSDVFNAGITIVTNKGAVVTINDQDINNFSPQGPFDVTGNTNYVTYKVSGLSGNIKVNSDKELYCAYFNANTFASTGAFYSGFPAAPEINFNNTVTTLGSCIPNVTLQAANTDLFDSFEWQYFNETTNAWETRSVTSDYKPILSEPGRYKLIGTLDCTGAKFESIEIPVSICPDDFDNDLIIDNLDVDLDNDGILNCDESIGDAKIDLTNPDNAAIIFADGTRNSTIIEGDFTVSPGTSSFTGDADGNFTATANTNSTNSNLLYELDFTRNINFKFTQTAAPTFTDPTDEEGTYYILKIEPNNKNITLVDPDDQLLIDTDFDDVFEPGITNISASEIRFKINPNPTGTTPYEFVSNQVDKVSFKIKTTALKDTTTFSGNIQLTCFALDSDGDGIENALDLDSDNDGILDIHEAVASRITLANTDANLDGLDDAFDGITTNIDSDNDGVPNYLDVDSDNDGIFDLEESGSSGTDANNDGILDNANNTTVGLNGLLNSLETSADSNTLNYTPRDTDTDNIFNFLELDADNDDCFDVIEAGFTGNGSGILSASPFAVNANGKVINNTDGYTTPNVNYITSAPIELNTPFEDVILCENLTGVISIDSNADTYQWQQSTDNGTTWASLADDAVYNGVTTKDLQITNVPISFSNYQFRVLQSRVGNSCLEKPSNAITLTINPEPVVNAVVLLQQCDTDPDKQTTFNLTEAEVSITNTANTTFTYYRTEAAAISGTPEVTDVTAYFVDTTGEAWVRTISDQGCYIISKIELTVSFTPNQPYEETFSACDDLLDADGNNTVANSDTDGITYFDFSAAPAQISTDSDIEIEFYETEDERTRSVNEIQASQNIAQYRNKNIPNTSGNRFPIYYKLTSKTNNDCQGLGQIYLRIDSVPIANTPSNIEECDDAASGNTADGENININLRTRVSAILGNSQTEADFNVTFHTTEDGAKNNTDIITNDTSYTNEAPATYTPGSVSEQNIYVRVVQRNGGQCYNANTSFKIIIQPIPTVPANVTDLIVCDVATASDADPRNRIAQGIDLTSRNTEILNARTGYKVEFYTSQADANNRTNTIANPANFQNSTDPTVTTFPANFNTDDPATQTIFFLVVDENGLECPSVFSTFQVLIYPEPFTEPISVLSYCDNDDDRDDTNGIIQTIDLNGKIPEILGTTRNADDYIVTFHNNTIDASTGGSPLASPYENGQPTETIYVRIQNKNSGCVNDEASFQLIVNPLPDFTVTSPQIACLNNLPLNISVENPSDIYTYVWTDENGTVLNTTSVDNIDVSSGGNYKVTATANDGTMCTREETITVNESNVATLEQNFITIVDESNNLGTEDNLSISIDTNTNDLGPGDYQFAILNIENNQRFPIAGYQNEPLFENLEGGIYLVIVNDANGCSPNTTLLVSVLQFPKFFTPNADGENDTWVVKGANKTFYPNSSINIFNRFGKLVAQVPLDGQGWDGTYGGKLLPSDDYWFDVNLIPADTSKPPINKKGHFSLLRR